MPPPMNVLLAKGKLQLSGEMLSYSWLDHSLAGGTSWIANNELAMMCVFLMRDGRYESSVTNMPFGTTQNIEITFQSFVTTIQVGLHQKKLTSDKIEELQEFSKEHFKDLEKDGPGGAKHARRMMVNDGLSNFADTIPDLIQKKFGNSKNKIQAIYERQMNSLVKSVLVFHPGFLEKKVIVFPISFQNSHWGVTFVFNSGDIPHPFDQGKKGPLRTCFFYIAACILPVQEGFQTNTAFNRTPDEFFICSWVDGSQRQRLIGQSSILEIGNIKISTTISRCTALCIDVKSTDAPTRSWDPL